MKTPDKLTEDLLNAAVLALPFVETAELDTAYKPGTVAKVTRQLRGAIDAYEAAPEKPISFERLVIRLLMVILRTLNPQMANAMTPDAETFLDGK